jgi:hypothetical protein
VPSVSIWSQLKTSWLPKNKSSNASQIAPCHLEEVPTWFTAKNLDYRRGEDLQIPQSKLNLCYNYPIIKVIAAILQTLYGSYEVFRVGESQFERYGFAAYSLTIIPYIIMSLVNLMAALIEPEYPTMYLVYYGGETWPEEGDSSVIHKDLDEEECPASVGTHRYHRLNISEGVYYALI